MATLRELLHPQTIINVISRIRKPTNRLQRFFGCQIGGPRVKTVRGTHFAWDIYDNIRDVATLRAAGMAASSVAANPIGQVSGRMLRSNEKLHMYYEELNLIRNLGSPQAVVDDRGQAYINRQESTLQQRNANLREWVLSRMLRGLFYVHESGEDWIPSDTSSGALFTVDFQVPASHLTTLSVMGGMTDWNDTSNGTPITDLLKINAASEEESGLPIEHVWLNSNTWTTVLKTDEVIDMAGSSEKQFDMFEYSQEINPEDNRKIIEYVAVLRGLPTVQFHIYDAGLKDPSSGSFSKFFPDNKILCVPEPSADWQEMLEGSEIVDEGYGRNVGEQYGFYAWSKFVDDPAGIQLFTLTNFIPALYLPKAIFYGSV